MKRLRIKFRIIVLLIILSGTILLTGCYDTREIDELAYPLAIGMDIGEADSLRLTLQLAAPLAIGGGGGGSGGGGGGGSESETSSIITVDTPSLYSGVNLINNIISKEINLSHAKTIIISRKLAESGVTKYFHAIVRGREFRPDVFIVISNCPAEEYLKNVKPTLESNPSKYYELLLGKKFTSFYPSTRLNDFYFNNESDYVQPVAILSDLGKFKSTDELKSTASGYSSAKGLEGRYEAGSLPIVSQQKNEVMGMAVFKDGKMVGMANGAESVCYHLITGDYKYSYWTITDPEEKDKIIVLNILQRRKPVIKVDIKNNPVVTLNLDIEGDFTAIQSGRDYENSPEIVEQATEQMIKDELTAFLKRTTDEFNSDICGFGRFVKGKFLTWDSWEKYKWFEKYKSTTFNIMINLKIRRSGLMIRSVGGE
jgi:spore germination protein KC